MGFSEKPPQYQPGKVRFRPEVPPDLRDYHKFGAARLPKAYWLLPWALDTEVSWPDRIHKAVL